MEKTVSILKWVCIAAVILISLYFFTAFVKIAYFPNETTLDWILPKNLLNSIRQLDNEEPNKLSDFGDYLNFLIGVPLALAATMIGAAVTVFIASNSNKIGERQQLLQSIQLADEKLTAGIPYFHQSLLSIDDFNQYCIAMVKEIQELFNEIEKLANEGHDISASDVLDRNIDSYQGNSETLPIVERLRDFYIPRFTEIINDIEETFTSALKNFQRMTFDPVWSKALDCQLVNCRENFLPENNLPWNHAIAFLNNQLSVDIGTELNSPRAIARELKNLANVTEPEEILFAYTLTPQDGPSMETASMETVCAMLDLIDANGNFRDKAVQIALENDHDEITFLNFKLAQIIALYKSIPSPNALRSAVHEIFPELKNRDSSNYFQNMPDKKLILSDSVQDVLRRFDKTPDALIYTLRRDENRRFIPFPDRQNADYSDIDNTHHSEFSAQQTTNRFRLSGKSSPNQQDRNHRPLMRRYEYCQKKLVSKMFSKHDYFFADKHIKNRL